jgi:transketolase
MAAAVKLEAEGVRVRVVSAPWLEAFERQDADYRRAVLPPGVPRVAIEAGVSLGWKHIVGETGAVIGVDHFGASAPDKVLAEQFGFTPDNVVRVARGVLAAQAG